MRRIAFIAITTALLGGCASQSIEPKNPVWVSKSINGLQRSPCHCGGIETEAKHKANEKIKEKVAKANGTIVIVRDDK